MAQPSLFDYKNKIEWINEVVYFKSGHGRKTFTIVHGLEKGHASPDLTGAKSHQKMMASLLDT